MNQAFSEAAVVAGRNLCNKLWNIARLVQGMVDEVEEGGGEVRSGNLTLQTGVRFGSRRAGSDPEGHSTENMGEDWICREIDEARVRIEELFSAYRLAEVEEVLYDLTWNRYADWFLESQKMFRNTALLRRTLTDILVMLHPLAPFVTEAIWQTLSWTEGMCINAKWPSELAYDAVAARNFEKLQTIVLAVRRVSSALSAASGGMKYSLLYLNDSLVDENQVLIQRLSGVPGVVPVDVARGVRLAVANSEVYLDAPADVVLSQV